MGYIGAIIKDFREEAGLSRRQLCIDICTEKYLYLIEKGDRTPSAEILKLLSNRLDHDLFAYYKHLDCENPVEVFNLLKRLDHLRYSNDFDALAARIKQAKLFPDFLREPYSYEIDLNNFYIMIMGERNFELGSAQLGELISQIPGKYSAEHFVVEMNMLLCYSFQGLGNMRAAKEALETGEACAIHSRRDMRFDNFWISMQATRILLNYKTGNYQHAAEESVKLYGYQMRKGHLFRIPFSCLMAAYSFINLDCESQAVDWFKKALYAALLAKNDSFYMTIQYCEFNTMLCNERVPRQLVDDLLDMYDIKA